MSIIVLLSSILFVNLSLVFCREKALFCTLDSCNLDSISFGDYHYRVVPHDSHVWVYRNSKLYYSNCESVFLSDDRIECETSKRKTLLTTNEDLVPRASRLVYLGPWVSTSHVDCTSSECRFNYMGSNDRTFELRKDGFVIGNKFVDVSTSLYSLSDDEVEPISFELEVEDGQLSFSVINVPHMYNSEKLDSVSLKGYWEGVRVLIYREGPHSYLKYCDRGVCKYAPYGSKIAFSKDGRIESIPQGPVGFSNQAICKELGISGVNCQQVRYVYKMKSYFYTSSIEFYLPYWDPAVFIYKEKEHNVKDNIHLLIPYKKVVISWHLDKESHLIGETLYIGHNVLSDDNRKHLVRIIKQGRIDSIPYVFNTRVEYDLYMSQLRLDSHRIRSFYPKETLLVSSYKNGMFSQKNYKFSLTGKLKIEGSRNKSVEASLLASTLFPTFRYKRIVSHCDEIDPWDQTTACVSTRFECKLASKIDKRISCNGRELILDDCVVPFGSQRTYCTLEN